MPTSPTFAQRLRETLSRHNVRKGEFAEKLGVEPRTVTNWITERPRGTEPSAEMIARICDTLGVSADYMLGRTDQEGGLDPGSWIIDLDVMDDASSQATWSVKVPRRYRIVSYDEMRQLEQEHGGGQDGNA